MSNAFFVKINNKIRLNGTVYTGIWLRQCGFQQKGVYQMSSTLMLRRRVFNGDFIGVLGVFGDFGDITSSSSGAESSGPHADAGTVAWRKTSFMEVLAVRLKKMSSH